MIRVGIMGMASIAVKRMIPAILKDKDFSLKYIAVASAEEHGNNDDISEKVARVSDYAKTVGAQCICGYEKMLERDDVDLIYIPLPPALHYKWALKALDYGKDIILEKPFTTSLRDTEELVKKAEGFGRVVIENYGFINHNQVSLIRRLLDENQIGELALVRASFGFPHRDSGDFRYDKESGGGALLDCGGYTLKAASLFLGSSTKVLGSSLKITQGHEVDIYGNALLVNDSGLDASVSFGMDNSYKCELELWGSRGTINASRFFTAPDGFEAPVKVRLNNGENLDFSASDDQFLRVLENYKNCKKDTECNSENNKAIMLQAYLVEECSQNVYA